MRSFADVLWIELRKAIRSRIPLFTALGFLIGPLAGALFMVILKDPEAARSAGLITAKAQLTAGTADWPTYLGLLSQVAALGGMMVFSFVASWVFGREFVDGTVKDLLSVPVSRSSIVVAKFSVYALWCLALAALVYLAGLGLGALVGLPEGSPATLLRGTASVAAASLMVIAVVTPIALLAGVGRGYLPPLGGAVLALVLSQVVGATGWGDYFPWAVPALYAGAAGPEAARLGPISFLLVIVTGVAGGIGTFVWWKLADQNR